MSTLKMSDEDFEKNMEFISQNFGPALADSFRARDAGQRTALEEATKLLIRAERYAAMHSEDKRKIKDFLKTQRPQPTNFCGTLELAARLAKEDEQKSTCRDCNGTGWFYGEQDLGPCPCPEGSKKP